MANCLLPKELVQRSIHNLTASRLVEIEETKDGYTVAWHGPDGRWESGNIPSAWLLESLNGFEELFAKTFLPKKKANEKPDCACTWEQDDEGTWLLASMCGAHYEFVRKYFK